MLRALLSGVAGLKNQQLRMDVIGNNIANVNTIGFKGSRVTFQEGFAEVLASATRSSGNTGGRNPSQVGSGSVVASIDPRFTQGALEATGQPLDLAIQGDNLFALREGERNVYSRAGNFQIDSEGRIVLGGTEAVLQGKLADAAGNLSGSVGDLVLQLDAVAPPAATSQLDLQGNLDASAEVGSRHTLATTVYDATGEVYSLSLDFTYEGDGAWSWDVSGEGEAISAASGGTLRFNEDGTLAELSYTGGASKLSLQTAEGREISIELAADGGAEHSGLTSFAGVSTAAVVAQDGHEAGELVNINIGSDGLIEGVYSNGASLTLGQIALAGFTNPMGLLRTGGNLYEETAASGTAVVGFGGEDMTSVIYSGALEGSNVDISEEFTNMIITQRGFQASARVITLADELLSELIALKR